MNLPEPAVAEAFRQKLEMADLGHVVRALVYFDDAENEPELRMTRPAPWVEVKESLRRAVESLLDQEPEPMRFPNLDFSQVPGSAGAALITPGQRDKTSEKMPESWRWIEKLGTAQDQQAAGALGMWFPTEATLVVVPGQDAGRHVLFAADFKGFVRPIRALITSSAGRGAPRTGRAISSVVTRP